MMLSVADAQAQVFAAAAERRRETVPLIEALGRYLAADVLARLTQPPFNASAMDGYAVRFDDLALGIALPVIGESIAGKGFNGVVEEGTAVRILTGAPVPAGADTVVVQEDVRYEDGAIRLISDGPDAVGRHIRKAGLDFAQGQLLMSAGTRLDARAVALLAAAGHSAVDVYARPRVAILSNGDELVPPGATPGPDQIVNSNGVMLAAMLQAAGADVRDLGILPDKPAAILDGIRAAADCDVIVTAGGASVGDHDYVQAALVEAGAAIDFWKIAMRPGKPMMLGRLGKAAVLGLPGNPVSAFVCAHLFLIPLVKLSLGACDPLPDVRYGRLMVDLPANGPRTDYMRAEVSNGPDGWEVTPFSVQDSSMLSRLAAAGGLAVRPAHAAPSPAGSRIAFLPLNND